MQGFTECVRSCQKERGARPFCLSTTGGAHYGGAEALNGLVYLHRRAARGFRNGQYHRLRKVLIGGALICERIEYEDPPYVGSPGGLLRGDIGLGQKRGTSRMPGHGRGVWVANPWSDM